MEKRFDKKIDGLTKVVQQGMRILVNVDKRLDALAAETQKLKTEMKDLAGEMKGLAAAQKSLAIAQKETEATLKAFIAGSRNGRNGRAGH